MGSVHHGQASSWQISCSHLGFNWNHLRGFKEHLRYGAGIQSLKATRGESNGQLGLRAPIQNCEFLGGRIFIFAPSWGAMPHNIVDWNQGHDEGSTCREQLWQSGKFVGFDFKNICFCLSILIFSSCVAMNTTDRRSPLERGYKDDTDYPGILRVQLRWLSFWKAPW